MSGTSTKPYLIRAIHEWCTDNGFRPYLAVAVDERTIVPREFVRGGEIVLNVSIDATNRLQLRNDMIEFEARFGGVARQVSVPVDNVTAIYAAENGHGMSFEAPVQSEASVEDGLPEAPPGEAPTGQDSRADAPAPVSRGPRGPVLVEPPAGASGDDHPTDPAPAPPSGGRPRLTRVK